MPNKVITTLNQLIRADLAAAEVVASPRPFAGYSLKKLNGMQVKLSALIWSFAIDAADVPKTTFVISLQRGLQLTPVTEFPAAENTNQMVFQYFWKPDAGAGLVSTPEPWFPAVPFTLEPGDSYALTIQLVASAAFAQAAIIMMTPFGKVEPVSISEDMAL